MAALGAFLIFQLYELVTKPSLGVAVLTVNTWRGTVDRIFRRPALS